MQPSIRLQCSDIMGRYQDLSKGALSDGHTVLPQTCLTLRHVIEMQRRATCCASFCAASRPSTASAARPSTPPSPT